MKAVSVHRRSMIAELNALRSEYARAQRHCSALIQQAHAHIRRLEAELIRVRARLIARDTALAWAREDQARLLAEGLGAARAAESSEAAQDGGRALTRVAVVPDGPGADIAGLEERLLEADLVICQTGCLSHRAYWRVQDYCRRHNKPCVMMAEPDALRVIQIHRRTSSVVGKPSGKSSNLEYDAEDCTMLDTTVRQGAIEEDNSVAIGNRDSSSTP